MGNVSGYIADRQTEVPGLLTHSGAGDLGNDQVGRDLEGQVPNWT